MKEKNLKKLCEALDVKYSNGGELVNSDSFYCYTKKTTFEDLLFYVEHDRRRIKDLEFYKKGFDKYKRLSIEKDKEKLKSWGENFRLKVENEELRRELRDDKQGWSKLLDYAFAGAVCSGFGYYLASL